MSSRPESTKAVFTLHPKQLDFIQDRHKFKAFVAGVGSGKSFAGALDGMLKAVTYPGSLGVVVAPSYPMLRDATLRSFLQVTPRQIITSPFNKAEKSLKLRSRTGAESEVLFRSADNPESLRGPTITWFWIDEACLCSPETWDIMIGRLRQGPDGIQSGTITSTPRGFDWVYNLFIKEATDEYHLVHATTMDNRANLPSSFVASMKDRYSGSFYRQEVLGEFTAFEGLVYPGFSRNVHVLDPTVLPEQFHRVIAGVDFGFTNPTAVTVVGLDGDLRAYVLAEFYKTQAGLDEVVQACKELRARYHVDQFYGDPAEPQGIKELNKAGVPTVQANNAIITGVQEVSSRLIIQADGRPRLYVSRSCVNVIDEFEQYRYPDPKPGQPVQDKPLKVKDHAMDSLRYALLTMGKGTVRAHGGLKNVF